MKKKPVPINARIKPSINKRIEADAEMNDTSKADNLFLGKLTNAPKPNKSPSHPFSKPNYFIR